jgi:UDPglucose 6-dehydrogenase
LKISVVGQGYVGLVTAAGAAAWGHQVTGVEVSPERLAALQSGFAPFHEPGLADLIEQHLGGGLLSFTGDGAQAIATSKITFVAVGTIDSSQRWDMQIMRSALASAVPHVPDDGVIVIRSTCPPDFVAQLPTLVGGLRAEAGRNPIPVLLNPEFTKEGTAVRDFLSPDRVVLGVAVDPKGRGVALLREFYAHVTTPVLVLPAIDASLAKLGANRFLATKISFANELASLCDLYGAQVEKVVEGMAYDPRIGGSFLRAGIGFGGSCLPDQVTMTVRDAATRGQETPLLAAVDLINARQRSAFADRIDTLLGGAAGQRVALLGLTFKPHTDDLRAAPSLDIARALIAIGATVVAFDPMEAARRRAETEVEGLIVVENALSAITDADAIGLVTEWPEFVSLPWRTVARLVARRIVVDGRNALDADALVEAGFVYSSFGRGNRAPAQFDGGIAAGAAVRRPSPVGLELAVGE